MDWSIPSAYFHPQNTLERQDLSIHHPINAQDILFLPEASTLTLRPTQLLDGHQNENNSLGFDHDSAIEACPDTAWTPRDITAHEAGSFIGPNHGPTIPHDTGFGTASTGTSTKPASEQMEPQPKTGHGGSERLSGNRAQEESVTNSLRCTWTGCKKPGPFSRKSVLARHVATHENPRSFKCPILGCDRRFNRKDNMTAHVQIVHANGY